MTAAHPLLELLAAERHTRGLTQAAAAHRAGYGPHTVRRWESGARQPSLIDVEAYANTLGLTIVAVPIEDTTTEAGPGEQLPLGELVLGAGERYCRGCQQVRAVREFDVDNSKASGRRSRCKHCRKDLKTARPERRAGEEAA